MEARGGTDSFQLLFGKGKSRGSKPTSVLREIVKSLSDCSNCKAAFGELGGRAVHIRKKPQQAQMFSSRLPALEIDSVIMVFLCSGRVPTEAEMSRGEGAFPGQAEEQNPPLPIPLPSQPSSLTVAALAPGNLVQNLVKELELWVWVLPWRAMLLRF